MTKTDIKELIEALVQEKNTHLAYVRDYDSQIEDLYKRLENIKDNPKAESDTGLRTPAAT